MSTNNAYDVLSERGFVQQVTDAEAVRALFAGGGVVAYVGYDPTAPSLHVGHLFTLMALKHLELTGNRPVALLGGGTALVGDPSGKTEMRKMLTTESIAANLERLRVQIGRLLHLEGSGGPSKVLNNADWLGSLRYIDFLREIGRHFSVNRMLSAEAYKQRLERGLSFIEFNYQLLQAYDFRQLQKQHDCVLQLGGDDQWGNILAGVDLCRRMDQRLVHGLTSPLLLTATGEKMGKTASGAVWLDPELCSPYDYYQYWVNVHDDDVQRLLGYFTFLPMDEIRAVEALSGAALNAAKSILAYEATAIVHGVEIAVKSHEAALGAFGGRTLPGEVLPSSKVPREARGEAAEIPATAVEGGQWESGVALVDALVQAGLAASKNAARRLVTQGAVRVNDERTSDAAHVLGADDLVDGVVTLRVGKKKVHRLIVTQ